jgi:putative peptidoglycan lipid II flippase
MREDGRALLRTVSSISLATLISRVLGLVRDQVQSFYFGAGIVTDAFLAAFRVPNLLRDLFAEGALSSAFVPTFTEALQRGGRASAWRLANRVLGALGLVLGTLTVLILVGAPWILRVYTPGFAGPKLSLAATMTRILSPFLLCMAFAAVAMGMLNACGRFFVPALAPVFFNLAAIVGVIGLVPLFRWLGIDPGLSLAVGAAVGGVLQFVVQLPALRVEGYRMRPELVPSDPGVRRMAQLMLPATFGLAATQLSILVDTLLASFYQPAITWLALAFRLMQLPIGLFGVAIATANLARVSRDAARGDTASLRGNLSLSLRTAALLTLPSTAGLIALREPIVALLFEHGRFTAQDTLHTGAAVLCYSLGLYAYAVTKIQVPTFYALGDTTRPVQASAAAVVLKIVASLVLLRWLPTVGVDPFLGLALSTSLAAWTNFSLLAVGLRRRIGSLHGGVLRATAVLAGLSLGMGLACDLFHGLLVAAWADDGMASRALRLGLAVAFGLGLFLGGAVGLRLPEAVELGRRLRAGGSRRG